jgi:hypothetical protein
MKKTIPINKNQTKTLVADQADVSYVVNATIHTPGLAIDASQALTGRELHVNGVVWADGDVAILIGDESLVDSGTVVKIESNGSLTSNGKGVVATSGGVSVTIAGTFTTDSTGVTLSMGGNIFENDGKMIVNEASDVVSRGKDDIIHNTGGASLTATQDDAIVSTGDNTSITNDGTAAITSTSGSAIVARGQGDTIYNTSGINGTDNAIVSSGANVNITNEGNGSISSNAGRGISSTGAGAHIVNNNSISTKRDGIFSSGTDAVIANTATIGSWDAAGIHSTGARATITNLSTLNGGTVGVLSTGNHAKIGNYGDLGGNDVGVEIAGKHSSLVTTAAITGDTAIAISGSDAHVTIRNEISGGGKHSATIDITAAGVTHIRNFGAVNSSLSGIAVQAGNGSERIVNTGSLNGNVDLGGGNDVFSSLTGAVSGKVSGGSGNDTYIIGIDLGILETKHGGTDTVESRYSYTLGANLENLVLLGKGTMEATGNNLANHIEGNAGNNQLTGAGGNDVFVFAAGCRQDTIDDFTDHADRIDLSGYQGVDNFSDLRGRIHQEGDNVTIILDGGDLITVVHMRVSHLSDADFIF